MRKTKEEYYRTQMARIRATKEQRAKEKEQGLTGMRRLAFVKDLIYGRGFTIQRIASRVPMTAQGLWWVFDVQDDCQLDVLERILAAVGVSCSVSLRFRNHGKKDSPISSRRYRFDGNVTIPLYTRNYPAIVSDCPEGSRMRFLADFIIDTRLPFSAFCMKSGYPERSYYNFFKGQRIKVSFICQIAERFDADVVWTLNEIS